MPSDPLVTRASDPGQVTRSQQSEKYIRESQKKDLEKVVDTPEGRRVLWGILEHCSTFQSIWHPSALIHYNAGKQDVGHFLLAQLNDLNPALMPRMMAEFYEQRKRNTMPAPAGRPAGHS